MNKRGLSFISWAFVLLILTVGYAVSQNADFDVDRFKENLNWTHRDIEVESAPDLGNALESLVNGLGEAAFSMAKWAAQWSAENPTVPFKLLIYLVLLAILAPVIILMVKLITIVVILIREFIQSRREKKMLKEKKYEN